MVALDGCECHFSLEDRSVVPACSLFHGFLLIRGPNLCLPSGRNSTERPVHFSNPAALHTSAACPVNALPIPFPRTGAATATLTIFVPCRAIHSVPTTRPSCRLRPPRVLR